MKAFYNFFTLYNLIALISIFSSQELDKNELKIETFPENIKKEDLRKESLKSLINDETFNYSFDPKQELAYIDTNVPLLYGFYYAYINHLPIRIRPDDIWLLIVQAFSNHVNINSEELRSYFVNFDGKKELEVEYTTEDTRILKNPKYIPKFYYEDFSIQINEQMKEYLGKEIVDDLTSNFSTTNFDSTIINKLSIMGTFKKYFDYIMELKFICGNPYIILEGTEDDYKKIISKAEKLSKYKFEWYIDRIIPIINKFVEAKQGKIDIPFFKDIIQQQEITENFGGYGAMSKFKLISGWIIKFFAYDNKFRKILSDSLSHNAFQDLVNQRIIVPFKLKIYNSNKLVKELDMKYLVGFIGCDQNEKGEVYPVQGWIVSPSIEEERESML